MGAVDYVFKPVDPIVLRSKVAVFVDLFAKTKEIERKARQEQALLDANLRANAERLRAEQELRRAEQRQAAIIQSLPMVLYLEAYDASPRVPSYVSGDLEALTGFKHDDVAKHRHLWADRLASGRPRSRARRDRGTSQDRAVVDRVSLALRRWRLQALPRPSRAAQGRRKAIRLSWLAR